MMTNKTLIHLCLLLLILLSTSCSHHQADEDPLIILKMKTCEAPCWQGIVPGITTITEANEMVHGIKYFTSGKDIIIPDDIVISEIYGPIVRFREPEVEAYIYADEEGIVDYIMFKFPGRNHLHLGDCIDLYGEPQFIGLSIIKGAEFVQNDFLVVYPNIGINFNKDMPRWTDLVKIPYSSSTKIIAIVYSSEPIERTDFDFIFPWNEEAILQFEKNY
jgi:hypothetical protein